MLYHRRRVIIFSKADIVNSCLYLISTYECRDASNGRSNPEVVGSNPTEVKIIFSLPRVVPLFPLLGQTTSGFSGMDFTWHFS